MAGLDEDGGWRMEIVQPSSVGHKEFQVTARQPPLEFECGIE